MKNIQLTEKQQKLITDNYRLLWSFIHKTIENGEVPKHLEDDFISDMFFKFCLSALKFSEESGFKFSTYAYGGFKFGLHNILMYKKNKFGRLYYFENIDEYKLKYKKIDKLESDSLHKFIDDVDLDQRDKSIIKDYSYEGLTFKDIGQKLNMSAEAVRMRFKKSLKKIKRVASLKRLKFEDFYK